MRRAVAAMRGQWATLTLVVGIMFTMSACGTSPTGATASATHTAQVLLAAEQATRAAEPVWADVTASEQGTIGEHNVTLTIAVKMTNRTDATIAVVHQWCAPQIQINVIDPTGKQVWAGAYDPGADINGCELAGDRELTPSILSGRSHTWTYVADLHTYPADVNPTLVLKPGRYTIDVLAYWDQGALNPNPVATFPPSVLNGAAEGHATVVVS